MAQDQTQYDFRTLDVAQNIVANIDNGIIVLDSQLRIHHYNRWLELHTKIKEETLLHKQIDTVFEGINAKTLKRKIKTALRMKTPTFYTANTSKYLIPIKLNQLRNSSFEFMQQDVSIIPFDEENELVALIITDQTIMSATNRLLEANIKKVSELNVALVKERETIDKRVLFMKIDKSGTITDISKALLELLFYEKDELVGVNFFSYEKLHLSATLVDDLSTHMQEKKVLEFEQKTLYLHLQKKRHKH